MTYPPPRQPSSPKPGGLIWILRDRGWRWNAKSKAIAAGVAFLCCCGGPITLGEASNKQSASENKSRPVATRPNNGDSCSEPGETAVAANGSPIVCLNNEHAKPTWQPPSELPKPTSIPMATGRSEPTSTKASSAKTKTTTRPPTRKPANKSAPSPRYQHGVHPGAFCTPAGALGYTVRGVLMVCSWERGDIRARWREA